MNKCKDNEYCDGTGIHRVTGRGGGLNLPCPKNRTIKVLTCKCGEEVYEDDKVCEEKTNLLECINCGKTYDTNLLKDEPLVEITYPKQDSVQVDAQDPDAWKSEFNRRFSTIDASKGGAPVIGTFINGVTAGRNYIDRIITARVLEFIDALLYRTRQEQQIIQRIDRLIAEEIVIALKAGEKTSRLTALGVKIKIHESNK